MSGFTDSLTHPLNSFFSPPTYLKEYGLQFLLGFMGTQKLSKLFYESLFSGIELFPLILLVVIETQPHDHVLSE